MTLRVTPGADFDKGFRHLFGGFGGRDLINIGTVQGMVISPENVQVTFGSNFSHYSSVVPEETLRFDLNRMIGFTAQR